jgi:hypothetical protein
MITKRNMLHSELNLRILKKTRYLFPYPIKLISTAADDPLCLVIEERKPGLTSGIRDLDDHDVPEEQQ